MTTPVGKQRTRRMLPRWVRTPLDPPERVRWVGIGPPELALTGRAQTMRACRALLARRGFTHVVVFRREWLRTATISGADAEHHLDADEQVADDKGYWWTGYICWSLGDRSARIVVIEDHDGNDLAFVGWGSGASIVLDELAELLLTVGDNRERS